MKFWKGTTVWCALIAFAVFTARSQVLAPSTAVASSSTPVVAGADKIVLLKGKVAGGWQQWLAIELHNGAQWRVNGYEPDFTDIVSDYQPLFRRLPNGQWEIKFVSHQVR